MDSFVKQHVCLLLGSGDTLTVFANSRRRGPDIGMTAARNTERARRLDDRAVSWSRELSKDNKQGLGAGRPLRRDYRRGRVLEM